MLLVSSYQFAVVSWSARTKDQHHKPQTTNGERKRSKTENRRNTVSETTSSLSPSAEDLTRRSPRTPRNAAPTGPTIYAHHHGGPGWHCVFSAPSATSA